MHHFIASSEQSKIVNSSKNLANVVYHDVENALHTIALRIRNNVHQEKSTIIIIKNEKERQILLSYLEKFELSAESIEIKLHQTVTESDLDTLRKRAQVTDVYTEQDMDAAFYYAHTHDKLTSYYQFLRQNKSSGGKTYRQILDDYLIKVKYEYTDILHSSLEKISFDFDGEEYNTIYQNIADALFVYQREFELHQNYEKLNFFTQEENLVEQIEKITYELFSFKEQALQIANRYSNVQKSLKTIFQKSHVTFAESLLDSLAFLEHKYQILATDATETGEYLKIFSKSAKEKQKKEQDLIHEINVWADKLSNHTWMSSPVHINNFTEILPAITQMKRIGTNALSNSSVLSQDYLKSINKLNYHDPILEDIEKDLNDLTVLINKSNLINKTFEINSLSLIKQEEYVHSLMQDFDILMLHLEKNIPYYQWKSFLHGLDSKTNKIIESLRLFPPNDWLMLFETYYLSKLLEYSSPKVSKMNEQLGVLLDSFVNKSKNEIQNSKIRCVENIKSSISLLKKSDPALYRVIVKKRITSHPILWKSFLEEHASTIATFYPVTIIDGDDIKGLQVGSYDEMICLDFADIGVDILQKTNSLYSFFPFDDAKVKICDYSLLLKGDKSYNQTIDTHTTGRISIVRSIAQELLQYGNTPNIYRLKNATIISFCTNFINDNIVEEFYSMGIKKLEGDQSEEEILIGALLDADKSVYIVTEDDLIHPDSNPIDFLNQSISLQRLQKAGCTILNIDSTAIFEDKGLSLKLLLENIKSEQKSVWSGKKQLSIEF